MEHERSPDNSGAEAYEPVMYAQAAYPYAALLGVNVQEAHLILAPCPSDT